MTTVIAQSEGMRRALELLEMAAPLNLPLLLIGESGVGRQTLGRHVHEKGPESRGPFVVVNLAAIPESDILASLFGRAPSLSTVPQIGLATAARGGTLLLQNIEDTPSVAQGVLLQMLQSGEVNPVGAAESVSLDARVVATTTPILEDYVTQGRFRADLFYRLNVIPIHVPPLRERREEILPLARHFIDLASSSGTKDLSVSAMDLLLEYPWPGNVQQLKNVVTRACLLTKNSQIDEDDLALERLRPRPASDQIISHLKSKLNEAERQLNTTAALSIAATPIWQGRRFDTDNNLCFVLMPFAQGRDLQRVYLDLVKPTVESCGLHCIRADDIYGVSGIMQSIWEPINRSRVIIAEMTDRNPNVFYELGIAHTLGKPVIMITQSIDDVPFDLKHLRCVEYEYKPHEVRTFTDALVKTLNNVLQTPAPGRML
jgi:hypothetical protein